MPPPRTRTTDDEAHAGRAGGPSPAAAPAAGAGDALCMLDVPTLAAPDEFAELLDRLRRKGNLSAGNIWGGAQALVTAALAAHAPEPVCVLVSTDTEAETFLADLRALGVEPTFFPARDTATARAKGSAHGDADAIRQRLEFAQRIVGPPHARPRLIVTSMLAAIQPVPALKDLEDSFLRLKVGDALDTTKLLARLIKSGYRREPLAEAPGEVSLRGEILDVFPWASTAPLRIEMFGDEVESLRTFDPEQQRSTDVHKTVEVCLASELAEDDGVEGMQLGELLAPEAFIVRIEPLRIEERAEALRVRRPEHERALKTYTRALQARRVLDVQSLPGQHMSLDTRTVQQFSGGVEASAAELGALVVAGQRVVIGCVTEAERDRVAKQFADLLGPEHGLDVRVGVVSKGFRAPAWRLVVVGAHELKGTLGARRRALAKQHQHKVRAIQSFFELKPGDHVVHAVHGLARYRGLTRMARGEGEEEHLHLEFADAVSLYVPASRVDMVQRYVGAGAGVIPLDKIGGKTFRKRKEKVERGLFDLAADMIEVQAKRELDKRPPWDADAEIVAAFLAEFPYTPTVDQVTADNEIAADLTSERSMDRLLCGDVGFGKTEMAVRAAFRVVTAGGQVAVLVPTTVLAEQHYGTFRSRMADFPVTVRALSRNTSPSEVAATLAGLKDGSVDIVVGTHRVLSKDVKFKHLGLVIIDEEQRFGVTHKERFKQLRASVDMLTLTATPIPRTLHMSLSGIRDISALQTPPPGRQAIETQLAYSDDDELIAEVLRRELDRGGQAFILHNKVQSIEAFAARIRALVPEATYAVGHGQMPAGDLQEVMRAINSGVVQVLIATTIIENGVDVPAAGTILIDDADHFGLSELHQLRGRVGRGEHKSYCYLMVERWKPLKEHARERLKALEELNHLGAGFGISVKDLELRGAGNVLGAQQSGHIAAIGYDMYCRLLKLTIERLQSGETLESMTAANAPRFEELEAGCELVLGTRAYLPDDWIPSPDQRLDVLRRLAHLHDPSDFTDEEQALRDRYGRIPPEAEALLRLFRLKVRLDPYQLRHLAWQEDRYVIQYADRVKLEELFAEASGGGRKLDLRPIRPGVAHLVAPARCHRDHEQALGWLEQVLGLHPVNTPQSGAARKRRQ
ncbi:MAG: transcription-repair coupling factor [Planctomycetota bacterium]